LENIQIKEIKQKMDSGINQATDFNHMGHVATLKQGAS